MCCKCRRSLPWGTWISRSVVQLNSNNTQLGLHITRWIHLFKFKTTHLWGVIPYSVSDPCSWGFCTQRAEPCLAKTSLICLHCILIAVFTLRWMMDLINMGIHRTNCITKLHKNYILHMTSLGNHLFKHRRRIPTPPDLTGRAGVPATMHRWRGLRDHLYHVR